jgi:hypothetical protein
MTKEEARTLRVGDMVRHRSGNIYRVWSAHGVDSRGDRTHLQFFQHRNGQDFGPVRTLKPESLTRLEAGP